jgi:predicted Rossmann-fold nucleotide-binding protein
MSGRRLVTGPTPHEVDTVAALEAVLDRHEPLHGLRLQDLDLTAVAPRLLRRDDLRGLVVLGGVVPDELAGHLKRHGAMVFPSDPHAPLEVYRPHLYTPDELYAGLERGYESTLDAVAYAWATDDRARHDAYVTLLRAIHDHSVTDALDEALEGRRVAGVMGGHAVARGEATYADAAHLGRRLAGAGLTVLTGGGPGAMEAANLGALATGADALETALARLAAVPSFRPSVTDWARLALEVRAEVAPPSAGATPASVRSIGIPTWFYGHEPPNVFCDGIGKYFSNALREDGLLARSTEGVVVLPGAAGTVQEIFQAITPLYYAPDGAALPRLVLVGSAHWTGEVPLWSAVEALGVGRPMSGRVHLVDDVTEAADILLG